MGTPSETSRSSRAAQPGRTAAGTGAPGRGAPAAKAAGERETSIRRGVEVLLSLATDEALTGSGLGVTRISELLGREKSQVSRALKALGEYGLVERDKDAGYRLGWRLYALAQLAGERRLLEAAGPMMRRLAHSLGERVHLSVLQGAETLTVVSESPGRSVQTTGWAGRVTPAYCTSAGRALLLDWDDDEITAVFGKVEFVLLAPKTVRTPRKLAAAVAAAREEGYVVVDGEFEPDLIGVAVPVRDARGAIIASLNASAPRYRFVDRVAEAARELAAVSANLSRELGDPEAVPLPS
ncbi:MAG TPA: IclR family transcriptional regulator [Solirubrobacteraceae bacterium]|nr:IclR family transcriptional regulator [Solirubrobacteraceae bacterium]